MTTISACVIAKNEEKILEKSLRSIANLVDKIIFVDTGSTDKTLSIAAKYTSTIFHKEWNNDFAFSNSTSDYSMLWDADFVMEESYAKTFMDAKNLNFNDTDQISVKWNTQFDDKDNPTAFVYRPIIFKTGKFTWKYPTHSIALPSSSNCTKSIYTSIVVNHEFNKENRNDTTKKHQKIVEKYLQNHPNDTYMSFALIEELYTLKEYKKVIKTASIFLNKIQSFPYPVQLLELVFFSYLQLSDLTNAINTVVSHKSLFLHKSRKYDILYADCLLYSDFEQAVKMYKYSNMINSYTLEQDYEYDLNRLNHSVEFSNIN